MKLFTFWIGPLSYIERLCLTSMVAAGHDVDLYTYDRDLQVPSGVTVRDAREVLPRDRFFIHRGKNSPAVFADLFRYEGLRRGAGVWVDTDVLVLRNLGCSTAPVFGRTDDRQINNAVLYLPTDSPILLDIMKLISGPVVIPVHWPIWKKALQRLAAIVGKHKRLEDLPWGTTGPRVLTYCATLHGADPQPVASFYPVHYKRAETLFDPQAHVEGSFTKDTKAVHLWNNRIKSFKNSAPPRGSFIARMCERYNVAPVHA